jgi:hypothetical protein
MTTEQKIIRAKVGLLELAKQLGRVASGVISHLAAERLVDLSNPSALSFSCNYE